MDSTHIKTIQLISRQIPKEDWLKLNCDGSVLYSGKASCGGLLRNALGEFLADFAANVNTCPIIVAEVWGAYYALELAWNGGVRKVIIEMDSLSVVSLIQGGVDNKHPYNSGIHCVRELMPRDWHV